MSTSGITTFSVTRDDIIKAALRTLRVLATGESPTPAMVTEANQALNMMIKAWQAKGMGLWLNRVFTITLVAGQQSYNLGAGTTTTRPLDILELRLHTYGGTYTEEMPDDLPICYGGQPTGYYTSGDTAVFEYASETPVELVSRQDYMDLTLKSSQGKINQAYYDPQLSNGTLYVWPTSDNADDYLIGTAKYPVEIFNSISDTPDFPEEWFEAIKFNLAKKIIPEYDVSMEHSAKIVILAQESLQDAFDFDREHTSVRFGYRSR
jgi:hypothetical protein